VEVGCGVAGSAEDGVGDPGGVDAAGVGKADAVDQVGLARVIETLACPIDQVLATGAVEADGLIIAHGAELHVIRADHAGYGAIGGVSEVSVGADASIVGAVGDADALRAVVGVVEVAEEAVGRAGHAFVALIDVVQRWTGGGATHVGGHVEGHSCGVAVEDAEVEDVQSGFEGIVVVVKGRVESEIVVILWMHT
jgi:hypothetical protein